MGREEGGGKGHDVVSTRGETHATPCPRHPAGKAPPGIHDALSAYHIVQALFVLALDRLPLAKDDRVGGYDTVRRRLCFHYLEFNGVHGL